ncbi:hypothetical protein SEA_REDWATTLEHOG_123 [Gordonia phage RedWattleHog]|uniref:Uncharacterized protein n=1 Tax=Gordonia phage Stormageddon TaxID=2656541 RepID=A0A649VSS0_9CAUD|nr:hypothetical protein KHQ86_gp178 [Gordonia phage Stormageddon]QGJ94982.1 hypothetical protein SEA_STORMAGEDDON_122 [Gordonia phage Stormageddon]QLF83626.1 hypothetical protein SEA_REDWATTLEHOG_123 [Gordonia phage RedWattleHog]
MIARSARDWLRDAARSVALAAVARKTRRAADEQYIRSHAIQSIPVDCPEHEDPITDIVWASAGAGRDPSWLRVYYYCGCTLSPEGRRGE